MRPKTGYGAPALEGRNDHPPRENACIVAPFQGLESLTFLCPQGVALVVLHKSRQTPAGLPGR